MRAVASCIEDAKPPARTTLNLDPQTEECLVDAENPAEAAACFPEAADYLAWEAAAKEAGFIFPAAKAQKRANANAVKAVVPSVDKEECIVDAENEAELQACLDDSGQKANTGLDPKVIGAAAVALAGVGYLSM